MDVRTCIHVIGRRARAASRVAARADTGTKNRALQAMAAQIRGRAAEILAANARRRAAAHHARRRGGLVDRVPRSNPRRASSTALTPPWSNLPATVHTDAIVTDNEAKARRFLREVDSSSMMVNASKRVADVFEYGLGAEIGISTDKLHVRPGRP